MLSPGIAKGIEPRIQPTARPKKKLKSFGLSRTLIESPRNFEARSISCASPTTERRSPSCRCRSGVARISIPARSIRVMLIPYWLRRRRAPSLAPLTLEFVMMIRLLTSWESIASQSMSGRFQSRLSARRPKNCSISSTSSGCTKTKRWSPSWSTVCEEGMISVSPRQMREMMKCFSSRRTVSRMVLPKRASFVSSSSVI